MSKSRSIPPKLGNNGGTAFVRINGKRIYLGKFDSLEARRNYARHIAEWASPHTAQETIGSSTVDTLTIAFLDYAQKSGNSHYHAFRSATGVLLQFYSGIAVDSFTPKCLAAVQHQFTQQIAKTGKRYSRQYCNTLTQYIRQMFRWGVAQELVSPITADALKYVPALRRGHTEAPESQPRESVSQATVDATLPYLLPTVAAMVQVQRWAVMRPNEVCRMRVGDIDTNRKDGIWLYSPPDHKGTWRGHSKIIPLGKPEQTLMTPYLEGKLPEQAVFSPRTAMQEKHTKDAQRRVSKMSLSHIRRAEYRAMNPCRSVREHYRSETYAQSIKRAVVVANRSRLPHQRIPHWTPYQLRHSGVTELTYEHGGSLDVARAVAGQRSIGITQMYNHADLRIAIEQAKKRR